MPDWERQFRDYMRDSHSGIMDSIRDSKQVSDEDKKGLDDAVTRFNENYEPQQNRLVDASVGGSEDEES